MRYEGVKQKTRIYTRGVGASRDCNKKIEIGMFEIHNPLSSNMEDNKQQLRRLQRRNCDLPMMGDMELTLRCVCETAKGDEITPDEAMHLAASLLFRGFRGVVATMW
jgi:CHAT domain-containing protein